MVDNCVQFCTKAECAELEARISALEIAVELLNASFIAHTSQEIPTAHNYNSNLRIGGSYFDQILTITVADQTSSDSETIPIPLPKIPDPPDLSDYLKKSDLDVQVNINQQENNALIKVTVTGVSGQDTLFFPEIPKPIERPPSNVGISGSYFNEVLTITITDGETFDTEQIPIPLPRIPEPVEPPPSNVGISGSYFNEVLTITITDGETFDTEQIPIPLPRIPEIPEIPEFKIDHVAVDVFEVGNREFEIQVSVENVSDSDTFTINIPDIPDIPEPIPSTIGISGSCENGGINLTVSDGQSVDTTWIDLCMSECDLTEIIDLLNEIKDELTIEISDNLEGNLTCGFGTENPLINNPLSIQATANKTPKNYSGKTFLAINQALQLINKNIVANFEEICKLIEPSINLTKEDLVKYCLEDSLSPESFQTLEAYEQALNENNIAKLENTPFEALINNLSDPGFMVSTSLSRAATFLSFMALKQGRTNNTEICRLEMEAEPSDVVSIVASPKYITNVEGKVLILHFVTLDNYPKRAKNSSYYQIQIPAAKEEYNWEDDFESLRIQRGNQYAEMRFEDYKAAVSAWFESVEAANNYFNAVLNLTTATEKNRVFPQHSNPQTNIQIQETRPYRAFIKSVNELGQAVCHAVYKPPIEHDE